MNVSSLGRTVIPLYDGVTARPAAAPRATSAAHPAPGAAPATRVEIPFEAPAGTDVQLWGVLTSAERAHFGRSGIRGPVAYGPAGSASSFARPGGTLDLRV